MIYLDCAATSWPKPEPVVQAMADFLRRAGGNPGRSGHRLSIEAARVVFETRCGVARLLGCRDPLRIVFTLNATTAINLALRGLLRPGDRVVTTGIEHNAVMRPLRALERTDGVEVAIVPCRPDGSVVVEALREALAKPARLAVITHASNVTGALLPVEELVGDAHRAGAIVLVDAAQTAGVVPIDVDGWGVDLLAFAGHKGLQGPPGTGGLALGPSMDPSAIEPLVRGGTGSFSHSDEQPGELPDRFESGTPNGVGLAGLGAGVRFVEERGVERIRAHDVRLREMLVSGLASIPGVRVFGPSRPSGAVGVVSFTVEGRSVSSVGWALDREFGVLCRVGLHCAPSAHRTIGTFPEGTVRFAPGVFTTESEIEAALEAVETIASGQTGTLSDGP